MHGPSVSPARDLHTAIRPSTLKRLAIAARLDVTTPSLEEWIDRAYGVRELSLSETFRRLTFDPQGPYQNTPTPTSLAHKYVTEDVPTGLIPIRALGVAGGVATPTLEALIHLASVTAGRTVAADARTIDRLGLAGQGVAQIQNTVQNGFT